MKLKEMMIDDINEDADDDGQLVENNSNTKWYHIDSEKSFYKIWYFSTTLFIIFSLLKTPYILIFGKCYHCYETAELNKIEVCTEAIGGIDFIIDLILLIDIIFNFLKKTHVH